MPTRTETAIHVELVTDLAGAGRSGRLSAIRPAAHPPRLSTATDHRVDRLVNERHERWAERELERYDAIDADDLARQERYGTDPIEGEDDLP